jgi:hypothetical protein
MMLAQGWAGGCYDEWKLVHVASPLHNLVVSGPRNEAHLWILPICHSWQAPFGARV